MIMKRLSYIFLALFIMALTACNTALDQKNTSEANTSSGKAYLSIAVNPETGRAMVLPQDMQEDEVVSIEFVAQQFQKNEDSDGSVTYSSVGDSIIKDWITTVQEGADGESIVITAFEQFRKEAASMEFEPGYYDFSLYLYVETLFPEDLPEGTLPLDIGQYAEIKKKELVEGKNTITFNTKYSNDNSGELFVEFTWNPLINQVLNNITSIKVGIYAKDLTSSTKPIIKSPEELNDIKTKYKNPFDKYPSNYLTYKQKYLNKGDYYLQYTIYSTDPLNENESYCYTQPPVHIKIDEYRTVTEICLDSIEFNTYYTINFLLDGGSWRNSNHSGITRKGYASYDFSDITDVIAPEYYSFKGWAECTSSGVLKSTSEDGEPMLVTKVPAGTHNNTWYKAIWEKRNHTITYDLTLNGEVLDVENNNPESFWEGDTIELLPLDDLEDYIFAGWAPVVGSAIEGWNPGEQTEDITLIAIWNIRPKYKVTFKPGEAPTEYEENQEHTEEEYAATTISVPVYTWPKHTFTGWLSSVENKTVTLDNDYTVPEEDVTFTAQWEANPKTPNVVFSTVPSAGEDFVEVDYGAQITLSCSGNGSGNAVIYYTTDETDPSESETRIQYDLSTPIEITEDTIIKAYAVNEEDDLFDSDVTSVIYKIKSVAGSGVAISFEPDAGVGIGSENVLQLTISVDMDEKEYTITASSVEKQYTNCLWFINGELVKDADGTTITSLSLTQDYSEYERNYTLYKIYCVANTAEGDSDDATYKLQVSEDW